ncbi:hypothetical protein NDI54_08010 [Haloarcula sp. S1AR25-5A]|uniref:Uncharacterized protein n=1 Tax=Haloarcula terrestris TaxID=2950533 RepID=A0AAE4EW58_9EURY|nr:hypothetical protein [Haloarcula terrestris]MDS0221291.1 hypothetical protein [Haloarcula terrestris]
MTNTVTTTVEPPDRTTTWAWGGRSPPGRPTEGYRQPDDTQCDNPNTKPVEQ